MSTEAFSIESLASMLLTQIANAVPELPGAPAKIQEAQRLAVARIRALPEVRLALWEVVCAMGAHGANSDVLHPLRAAWERARAALRKFEGES